MIKRIKRVVFIFVCGLAFCECYSQTNPVLQWQKCLGGTSTEGALAINHPLCLTSDGGVIIAGFTNSNNGNVSGNHGYYDVWVVKLDSAGNIQWQKCLGGGGDETANSIQKTSDGGYIIAAYTDANGGDVSGHHSGYDFWLVKIDSLGNIQWQKCLGGMGHDVARYAQQTNDGGYIVVGQTASNDGDVTGNHSPGNNDYWLVKTDSVGNIQWQKCYGGTGDDYGKHVQQTNDGSYIICGSGGSSDGDQIPGGHGNWILRVNSVGTIIWQKSYGGNNDESATWIEQTYDDGFIFTGETWSNSGDVSGNHGLSDYWVAKIDSIGTLQWQKCLGGTDEDRSYAVNSTIDHEYIVSGGTFSTDGDVTFNHGSRDFWIVKLDSAGNIQWQKSFGGTGYDISMITLPTNDGCYIAQGFTESYNGDVSGNHGDKDYWVIRFCDTTVTTSITNLQSSVFNLQLFPNPTTGTIQLTLNTKHNALLECDIINMMGERIFTSPLTPLQRRGESCATLDVSFLAKGIYLIRVGDGKRWENKKLVIE